MAREDVYLFQARRSSGSSFKVTHQITQSHSCSLQPGYVQVVSDESTLCIAFECLCSHTQSTMRASSLYYATQTPKLVINGNEAMNPDSKVISYVG